MPPCACSWPGTRPRVARMTDPARALSDADRSRVIEMAWDDQVPFEAIAREYGLSEPAVIALMRRSLKPGSYRVWRERVSGRVAKHAARRGAMRPAAVIPPETPE